LAESRNEEEEKGSKAKQAYKWHASVFVEEFRGN
jgi:hypothetical protein